MSSSSSQHSTTTTAPPPPEQFAAFYKLVDKQVIAGVLCRHARAAELSASAAVQAEELFGGEDSLVVANLRWCQSESLTNLAVEASGAEQDELTSRSWAVLLSLIPLPLCRLEANTLLPGTIREEELDYSAHLLAAVMKAKNRPVLPPAALRAAVSTMGYNTLLDAMFRSLDLLPLPMWPAAQKKMVESFVLRGLDVIPRTARMPQGWLPAEGDLVRIIEQRLNPQRHDPAFCAAVLHKWRSNAVSSVLQARGVLQTEITASQQDRAEFEARKRADIAKHGLRDCALPSCSKTLKTVKEFAGCSGCRFVVYCCLEHQALDWTAHKKACREKEAGRLAGEGAVEQTAGGTAAG